MPQLKPMMAQHCQRKGEMATDKKSDKALDGDERNHEKSQTEVIISACFLSQILRVVPEGNKT